MTYVQLITSSTYLKVLLPSSVIITIITVIYNKSWWYVVYNTACKLGVSLKYPSIIVGVKCLYLRLDLVHHRRCSLLPFRPRESRSSVTLGRVGVHPKDIHREGGHVHVDSGRKEISPQSYNIYRTLFSFWTFHKSFLMPWLLPVNALRFSFVYLRELLDLFTQPFLRKEEHLSKWPW